MRDYQHEDQAISQFGTHLRWDAGRAGGNDGQPGLDPAAVFGFDAAVGFTGDRDHECGVLGPVTYGLGEAEAGLDRRLDSAVVIIQKCDCGTVAIGGYTDSVGNAKFNLRLSQQRAEGVEAYLVGHGIQSSLQTAERLGEDVPVASIDTPAVRAENRRVTVEFNGLKPE